MKPKLDGLVEPESMKSHSSYWDNLDILITKSNKTLNTLTDQLSTLAKQAGTGGGAFKRTLTNIIEAMLMKKDLVTIIDSPLEARALGLALLDEKIARNNAYKDVKITRNLLQKIDKIKPNPSILFINNMLHFYFIYYDELLATNNIANWLKNAIIRTKKIQQFDLHILDNNGAKWLVEQSIKKQMDLDEQIQIVGLEHYKSGRFLMIAKHIYYVEQIRNIPINQPHPLLDELQKPSVFEAHYEKKSLLGHEVLRIIIDRSPDTGIDDSWRNVVMRIAGDPRISETSHRYLKWWLPLGVKRRKKVIGWLSHFDLRLFLEALNDFSERSSNPELKRMFPARKCFLEGLLNKKLVTGTRLYLPFLFRHYLQRHYKDEHLPAFSTVSTNDKAIVHVQLNKVHLIEGSHSCKLWIYKQLKENSIVFQYNKVSVSYEELTSGLNRKMVDDYGNELLIDNITHHPPLGWQHRSLIALKKANIDIHPKDVLSPSDYIQYKRKFGISL